ncbi:hypothetical protein F4824DRAFT_445236 [Ustulina deusta]|nr:hypothetical protein F4824DRAFT_445236 [Ustulina deusta]
MEGHLNGEVVGSANQSPEQSVHNQSPESTATASSHQSRASIPPPTPPPPAPPTTTAAANPGTQTSYPATATAGPSSTPTPPGIVPTASTAHQNYPATAYPPQHPARPPTTPWGHPPYPLPNIGSGAPPIMAAPYGWHQPFCYPPPHMQQSQQQLQYWYYYPGTAPAAGLPMTCTHPSPWWSGTSHYLTNPPPQAPQVYTVEPAYIIPQATYYQATAPAPAAAPAAAPAYYYVPGAPAYYYA